MKKINIKPGFGNYIGSLDLQEYINEVLDFNGIPVRTSCCISSPSVSNGQVLSWDSSKKKYVPTTVSGVGGVANLAYTPSAINGVITNTSGTGFTIPIVNSTNAGLITPSMLSSIISTDSNTYVSYTNGQIEFVINGVTEMILTPGKMTTASVIDPPVYAGTPITTIQRNAYGNVAGYLIYNSNTLQYEYNDGTQWRAIGGAGSITSVHGRSTSAIVATTGDYNTSQVIENTNLYFTEPRVLSTKLTGYLSEAGLIKTTDSVLQAIQKLDGNMVANDAAYIHKTGAETISGVKNFTVQPTGITAASINFDNTGTGMSATNLQQAIVELNTNLLRLVNTFNQPI